MEAIQSATVTNAKVLGLGNQLGQIKPKYIADIVATDTNPLEDISAMERVEFVMKEGKIYKN
jgi:imidazolonepropionase-like amidohydrolase